MKSLRHALKAAWWKRRGSVPHAAGAIAARWRAIASAIEPDAGPYGFSDAGVDERVVEYAWLFDRMRALRAGGGRVLDAGSVLNHPPLLAAWRSQGFPPLSIVTLAFEGRAFPTSDVGYEFADLRRLPYRDGWFSVVACLSTVEHVGMDNRIYGASGATALDPDREAVLALRELLRVTRPGGSLFLSVPFGASSNRGWFRIFGPRELERLLSECGWEAPLARYFRATRDGWRECAVDAAEGAGYNEPPERNGQRTAPAFVAAAEAVALIEMRRP